MATRSFKPTSPGRRFMVVSDFAEITKSEPEKSLLAPRRRHGGRNVNGRITTRHQGGGHKRRYRIIDFRRQKDGVPATVAAIEYDPNRSARIALLHYADGAKRTSSRQAGSRSARVQSGPDVDMRPGNCMPLLADPDRHHGARHRAEPRPGRQDGPLRRRPRAARGQGRRHRAAAPAVRRAAARAGHLPRHRRPGRQPGRTRTKERQGGSLALARQAAGRARHRDEPGRPPARRRRGQDQTAATR